MVTPGRSVAPIVAEALLVTSATLVAVTVTTPGIVGATYTAEVVDWLLNEPALADQVTPALPTSWATVAVKVSDCEMTSPPRFGVRDTLMLPEPPAVTVIVAAADLVPSVTDVAVKVTVVGFGTLPGAV